MKPRVGRLWRWMILIGGCGALFQSSGIGFTRNGLGGNCQARNFFQNGLLTGVDFCYLLDCQNGFFGGAFQPCGNTGTQGDTLLVDCPNVVTTTTTTTTQNP